MTWKSFCWRFDIAHCLRPTAHLRMFEYGVLYDDDVDAQFFAGGNFPETVIHFGFGTVGVQKQKCNSALEEAKIKKKKITLNC